jgi:hypothetical protein
MATHAPAGPQEPVAAPPPHTDAYMDMEARRAMWRNFGVVTLWTCMLLTLILGHAILTLTMGVNWLGSLILFTVLGVAGGLLMNMGGAWLATVFGLVILGLVVQGLIALGSALV